MNLSDKYLKVLNVIYSYYGMSEGDIIKLLKDKDAKYLLLLLLNRHRCIDEERLKAALNVKSKQSITYNLRRAEERLLLNREFRETYFELEQGLLK